MNLLEARKQWFVSWTAEDSAKWRRVMMIDDEWAKKLTVEEGFRITSYWEHLDYIERERVAKAERRRAQER